MLALMLHHQHRRNTVHRRKVLSARRLVRRDARTKLDRLVEEALEVSRANLRARAPAPSTSSPSPPSRSGSASGRPTMANPRTTVLRWTVGLAFAFSVMMWLLQ